MRHTWRYDWGYWLMIAVGIVVAGTCAQIEIKNAEAGGFLPRTLPEQGSPKWRHNPVHTEKRWRQMRADPDPAAVTVSSEQFRDITTQLAEAALSPEETAQMRREVAQAKAENDLYFWVSTMGILQYLLAPMALVWSLVVAVSRRDRRRRAVAAIVATASAVSLLIMFCRGYYSSLGW